MHNGHFGSKTSMAPGAMAGADQESRRARRTGVRPHIFLTAHNGHQMPCALQHCPVITHLPRACSTR
jgi:hypothetical protein